MANDTETAARELSPDDLVDVVGGTETGGVSKLGSRRLTLQADGTYSSAAETSPSGATLQLSGSLTSAESLTL